MRPAPYIRTLFRCPYCPRPRGRIALDTYACASARQEDPDPVYLEDERFVEGRLILFGRPWGRPAPCRHLLLADGEITWRSGQAKEDESRYDDEASRHTWHLDFRWASPRMQDPALAHSVYWRNHYRELGSLPARYLPTVPFAWEPVHRSWNQAPKGIVAQSRYELAAWFLVTADPVRFTQELEVKARSYFAHVRSLK